jgi:hypothetical protein
MKFNLLQSKSNGDLSRPVQLLFGVLSFVLATSLLLTVRSYIPATAEAGQLALAGLFLAAVPGYVTLLSTLLKVFQGGRVQPDVRR